MVKERRRGRLLSVALAGQAVLAGSLLLLVAACGGATTSQDASFTPIAPTVVVAVANAGTATPTPVAFRERPRQVQVGGSVPLKKTPLQSLSPDAASFLDGRQRAYGVAVILPDDDKIYVENGDDQVPLASVIKVPIMLTVIDQSITSHQPLSDQDMKLLRSMITVSDNDAASTLWAKVGGGPAVRKYLVSIGVTGIHPVSGSNWGDSPGSASAVAELMAKLAFGAILDAPGRQLAMTLLTEVDQSQRWGVTVAGDPSSGALVGMKDGWYPARAGWRVNSAGIFLDASQQPDAVVAILTRNQPSFEYGVATIEGVASRLRGVIERP